MLSGGVPARVIAYRFDKEIIEKLLKLQWWNFEESELVEIIPILQSADYERLFKLYWSVFKSSARQYYH